MFIKNNKYMFIKYIRVIKLWTYLLKTYQLRTTNIFIENIKMLKMDTYPPRTINMLIKNIKILKILKNRHIETYSLGMINMLIKEIRILDGEHVHLKY